jgi:hypothetical protein
MIEQLGRRTREIGRDKMNSMPLYGRFKAPNKPRMDFPAFSRICSFFNGIFALRSVSKRSRGFQPRALMSCNCLSFIGAGEGIRTLDPNLGKVVLYP